jgi:hypothetical protein
MVWFRCFIRGENFAAEVDGQRGLFGWYTTRFVEAASAEKAEELALQGLKAEPKLAPPAWYKPVRTARVFFEDIAEIAAGDVPVQQPGFAFYPMESES